MQKEYDFFELYSKFLNETLKGKRKGKNGKPIKQSSAENYIYVQHLLNKFCSSTGFQLKIINSNFDVGAGARFLLGIDARLKISFKY